MTDPTTTPATADAHTALMAALAAWREDVRPWVDPPKTDPLLPPHTTDHDLAAAYDAWITTPATVDAADLLALIRQAIGDTWATPEPVSAEEAQAVLSAVLTAVTSAGWPDRPCPTSDSDQSWEMAVADVDQLTAEVERLTRELNEARAEVERLRADDAGRRREIRELIRLLDKAQAERDEAKALVVRIAAAVDRVAPEDGPAAAHHDIPGLVTDLHTRLDEAQDRLDSLIADHVAHIADSLGGVDLSDVDEPLRWDVIVRNVERLRNERDAERERADQLARELEAAEVDHGRDMESWRRDHDALAKLRAEVARIADDYGERADNIGRPTEDTTATDRIAWLLCHDIARDLRALLDDPKEAIDGQ